MNEEVHRTWNIYSQPRYRQRGIARRAVKYKTASGLDSVLFLVIFLWEVNL